MNATFYASDYARLDSNVITGGGTDETEILQQLLDKAPELGHLTLIMDGAALVHGLLVHSNTTIQCMDKTCGFFLADHADCAILRNADPSFAEIRTRNITLTGGTYNHNCLRQAHDIPCDNPDMAISLIDGPELRHWTVPLEFYGIENLNICNLTIRDQRTFACTIGNFYRVNIENTFIELEHEIPLGNQDGFHIWGPGRFLTIRNVGGRTEDDFMNIGPDERDGVSSITDVLVDGVFLDRSWQGIRLLSRGSGLLDRVTVRNVTGTYTCFGFYINPWFANETMGNFGNITFENIDLRPVFNSSFAEIYTVHPPFLFSIGGDMESLTFRNIHWYHPDCDWNVFQIGYPFGDLSCPLPRAPHIRNMLIDGMQILETERGKSPDYIILRGQVDRLTVRNLQLLRPNIGGCLLKTLPDSRIGRLTLSGADVENAGCMLNLAEGEISQLALSNVLVQGTAEPIRLNPEKKPMILGEICNIDTVQ